MYQAIVQQNNPTDTKNLAGLTNALMPNTWVVVTPANNRQIIELIRQNDPNPYKTAFRFLSVAINVAIVSAFNCLIEQTRFGCERPERPNTEANQQGPT
jgi:hypothetical protein